MSSWSCGQAACFSFSISIHNTVLTTAAWLGPLASRAAPTRPRIEAQQAAHLIPICAAAASPPAPPPCRCAAACCTGCEAGRLLVDFERCWPAAEVPLAVAAATAAAVLAAELEGSASPFSLASPRRSSTCPGRQAGKAGVGW